ncbi:MAG: hypothetical protein JRH19_05720 [Deltaproteobacteria bacterium]|nr:hypothetical protein [Deltaproteobacteria bacterium]
MKLFRSFQPCLGMTLFVALWIAMAFAPAQAARLTWGRIGDNIEVSTGFATYRGLPSAAADTTRGNYLVVWEDNSRDYFNHDIVGQVVSLHGSLVNDNYLIAAMELSGQHDPAVAWNENDAEYLVVWRTRDEGFANQMLGRRLGRGGTQLWPIFPISTGGYEPAVVYNLIANQFLVTGRSTGVLGRRVVGGGETIGEEFWVFDPPNGSGFNGDLALDSNAGRYMATAANGANWALEAQLVSAGGTLLGEVIGIDPSPSNDGGRVAFDPVKDRHLVVYATVSGPVLASDRDIIRGWDLWGQYVSSQGALIGGKFLIDNMLEHFPMPAVAYGQSVGGFLVAYLDGDAVRARLIDAKDRPVGASILLTYALSLGEISIAYHQDTGRFLVVWADQRNAWDRERLDIVAQLVPEPERGLLGGVALGVIGVLVAGRRWAAFASGLGFPRSLP